MFRFRPWVRLEEKNIHQQIKLKAIETDKDLETFIGELVVLGYQEKYGVSA